MSFKLICSSFVTVSPEEDFRVFEKKNEGRKIYHDAIVQVPFQRGLIDLLIVLLFHVLFPNDVSILRRSILH